MRCWEALTAGATATIAKTAVCRIFLNEQYFDLTPYPDTFSRNTRNQLKQVFDALRELMTPPDPPKRPIGFVRHEDKRKKTLEARDKQ